MNLEAFKDTTCQLIAGSLDNPKSQMSNHSETREFACCRLTPQRHLEKCLNVSSEERPNRSRTNSGQKRNRWMPPEENENGISVGCKSRSQSSSSWKPISSNGCGKCSGCRGAAGLRIAANGDVAVRRPWESFDYNFFNMKRAMPALHHHPCGDLTTEDRRQEVVRIFAVAVVRCCQRNRRCPAHVRSGDCSQSREDRHTGQKPVPMQFSGLKTQA